MEAIDIQNAVNAVIPDQCRNCGVQCEKARELGMLMAIQVGIEHLAGRLVGEDGQQFDEFLETVIPDDHVDEAKKVIRKNVSSDMDDIDDQIERKKDEIAANARACSGTLNMQAKKDGVTYTAFVCTSARVYNRGDSDHLPVHVRTK